MTESDRAAFAETVAAVYEFYGKPLSESSLMLWWAAMAQFDFLAVRKAFGQHSMNPDTGQFIPKPADVVKMLGGSTLDTALVAWSKLEGAIQSVGTYMTVVFDDPLIHRVVQEMGGWTVVGRCNAKDWPFRQNEFVNRYRGYRMRGETPAYPPRLVGITDGENGAAGYRVDDSNTRLIGDATKARQVLLGGTSAPLLGLTTMASAAAEKFVPMIEQREGGL